MSSNLCENCYKRPKFGGHRFCGKTCAAQAAAKPVRSIQSQPQAKAGPRHQGRQGGGPLQKSAQQLCIYCGQKPKFNNFDYCGKSCAALANGVRTKPATTQGVPTTRPNTTRAANAPPNNAGVHGPAPAKAHKAPRAKAPAPQDESTEEEEDAEEEEDGNVSTDLDAYPSDSNSESEDEPRVPAVAVSQPGAKSASKGGKGGSGKQRVAAGACAIPGCGKPPHVDRNGVKTMYCSTKHREEAVKLGLEAACILCKRYPQSSSDYFCSSACRDQSMTKT